MNSNLIIEQNLLTLQAAVNAIILKDNSQFNAEKYLGFGAAKDMYYLDNPQLKPNLDNSKRLTELFERFNSFLKDCETNEYLIESGLKYDYKKIVNTLQLSLGTQFYTPNYFIDNLFSQLQQQGLEFKTMLEPSAGSGSYIDQFIKYNPNFERIVAYEIDMLAATILKAKYLHDPRIEIRNKGFQELSNLNEKFDIIASNVPFNNTMVYDKNPNLKEYSYTLHSYFFAKALEHCSENGVISFLCPSGILHTDEYQKLREYMVQEASLVHALQLPNSFYETTDVNSAIITLSKNPASKNTPLESLFTQNPQRIFLKDKKGDNSISYHPMFRDMEIKGLLSQYVIAPNAEESRRPYGRLNYWFNNYADTKDFIQKFNTEINFSQLKVIKESTIQNSTQPTVIANLLVDSALPIFNIPTKPIHQLDLFDKNPVSSYDLVKLVPKLEGFSQIQFFFKLDIQYEVEFDFGLRRYDQTPFVVVAGKRDLDKMYYYQIVNLNDPELFSHNNCDKWLNRVVLYTHLSEVLNDYMGHMSTLNFGADNFDIYFNPTIAPDKNAKAKELFEDTLIHNFNSTSESFLRVSTNVAEQIQLAKPKSQQQEITSKSSVAQPIGNTLLEYINQNTWIDRQRPVIIPNRSQPFLVSFEKIIPTEDKPISSLNHYTIANEFLFSYYPISTSNKIKWNDYIAIRDLYLQGKTGDNLEKFNSVYDGFVNSHKELNSTYNKRFFQLDGYYKQLASIEKALGKKWVKSDVFNESFYKNSQSDISHLKNDSFAALQYCVNKYAYIDLDYIHQVSKVEKAQLLLELENTVFLNSSLRFLTKEQLLSGNLRDTANAFIASPIENVPIELQPIYLLSKNLVEQSVPPTVPFEDIGLRLGEHWIDTNIYQKFANHLFDSSNARVEMTNSGSFILSFEGDKPPAIYRDFYVRSSESKRSIDGSALLMQYAMRSLYPEFTYTVKISEDRVEKRHDAVAEVEAQNIIHRMQQAFKDFLLTNLSQEERNQLEVKFNYLNNSTIQAYSENSGEHLSFYDINWQGAASKGIKEVRPHQKKAIWKILQNKGGIVDHEVGLGKTMVLCILSHEMNRLNVSKKNLILCMKANVNEIAETYHLLYPQDKLFYPSAKDVEAKNLESFIGTIKNNDFDTIILSYEMFNKLPSNPDIERDFLEKEIQDLNESILLAKEHELSKREMKGLHDSLANKEAKMGYIMNVLNTAKLDEYISFDKLNIGHIIVDESHNFKNLTFSTYHKRVKGLGNPEGSQRATNLLLAIRSLQQKNKTDLQATFLSGTPISNSLTEMFLLFKYLIPTELSHRNLNNFDSFAQTFCSKSLDFELDVVGNIKGSVERFREFEKIPELSKLYGTIADYNTADNVGLDRPEVKLFSVAIDPDPTIQRYLNYLKEFAESGSIQDLGIEQAHKNSRMLEATNMGRLISLHPKLLNSEESLECNTKISACVRNVIEEFHSSTPFLGTQLIFCDVGTPKPNAFNVYDEAKRQLVEQGIPSETIAFIHDSTTDAKKEKLFHDMNSGNVRILIGSSDKAGTGLNVQKRLIAIHNLDVPWTPKALIQREGRIKRQGNWACKEFRNNLAHNYIYGVKGSIDMFMYQLISNKAKFINSARSYSGTERKIDMGDFDDGAGLSFAAFSATLSGDNSFLEKARLEGRLKNLELQLEGLQRKIYRANKEIEVFTKLKDRYTDLIPIYEKAFNLLDNTIVRDKENNTLNQLSVPNYQPIKGSGVNDLGEAFTKHCSSIAKSKEQHSDTEVARFYSFPIVLRGQDVGLLIDKHFFPVNLDDKTMEGNLYIDKFVSNARVGINLYKTLEDRIPSMKSYIERTEKNLPLIVKDSQIDTSELNTTILNTRLELSSVVSSINAKLSENKQDPKPPIKL
jgi:superfamily II DNA/RNA helicase